MEKHQKILIICSTLPLKHSNKSTYNGQESDDNQKAHKVS